jgi:ATP adenylyltransferase
VDKLWAPWRSKYIYLRKNKKCIFCGNERPSRQDGKIYILARTEHAFAMLNLYPYNNGHVMVAPYRHVGSLERLSDAELLDVMKLVNTMKRRLDSNLKPHGFNIGVNIGKIGGAGFAGHVHVHIVPRWTGDTNFMPIIAGTKIVSESLDQMYRVLSGTARTKK